MDPRVKILIAAPLVCKALGCMHNAYKAAERQWGRALGRDAGRIRGRPGEHGVLARGTAHSTGDDPITFETILGG